MLFAFKLKASFYRDFLFLILFHFYNVLTKYRSAMPEGPELYLASQVINNECRNRVFSGNPVKSVVNAKNPEIDWDVDEYSINAVTRGKELMLNLINLVCCSKAKKSLQRNQTLSLLFRFGMSGRFEFTSSDKLHKHAHLMFYTKDKSMVLSFVDVRRFGRWSISDQWSTERGPDPMFEYSLFRKNVLGSLDYVLFNKPICEVMLNQSYFNGIGNYLRAEILYRAGVPPFSCARTVLEKLKSVDEEEGGRKTDGVVKKENPDFLDFCHLIPLEVIHLEGKGLHPEAEVGEESSAFTRWLRCYYQPGMKTAKDSNGRTIWFKGEAGQLASKAKEMKGKSKRKPATDISYTGKLIDAVSDSVKHNPQSLKGDLGPSEPGRESLYFTSQRLQSTEVNEGKQCREEQKEVSTYFRHKTKKPARRKKPAESSGGGEVKKRFDEKLLRRSSRLRKEKN